MAARLIAYLRGRGIVKSHLWKTSASLDTSCQNIGYMLLCKYRERGERPRELCRTTENENNYHFWFRWTR